MYTRGGPEWAVRRGNSRNPVSCCLSNVQDFASWLCQSGLDRDLLLLNLENAVTRSRNPVCTAPRAAESAIITATSQADNRKSASASIAVPPPHSVALNWSASPSAVAFYKVYRRTVIGGPYSVLTTNVKAPRTQIQGFSREAFTITLQAQSIRPARRVFSRTNCNR